MFTKTKVRAPTVGDLVLFEGLRHRIRMFVADKVEFVSERLITVDVMRADGTSEKVVKPSFISAGFIADLRWSPVLKGWYLWGRVLDKGRGVACPHCRIEVTTKDGGKRIEQGGCVNCDDRRVVAALRDLGTIPARPTRQTGAFPAGGEHLNLYVALFSDGINWPQELANVRRGDGLTGKAKGAVAAYRELFKRKLADGYAAPDANDSEGEG